MVPGYALACLSDGDHLCSEWECSETVVEGLQSRQSLLQNMHHLKQRQLTEGVQGGLVRLQLHSQGRFFGAAVLDGQM